MTEAALTLKDEGLRLFEEGAYLEALENFEKAYEAFLAADQPLDAAEMLNNIGVVHRMDGRLDLAAAKLEEARAIFEQAGDRSRAAKTLGNLGPLYSKQKAPDKAIEAYKAAAAIFEELDDRDHLGEILLALGILQFREGHRQAGLGSYESGLYLIKNPTPAQRWALFWRKLNARLLGS